MRILVHGYNFSPEPVGIGRYTGEMCAWLAARGHDVQVVTSFPYYPWWQVQQPYVGRLATTETPGPRLTVHRVRQYVPSRPSTLKRALQDASFALASAVPLIRAAAFRPDAVISLCPPLAGSAVGSAFARLVGAASVIHVQDLQVDAALSLGMMPRFLTSGLQALERAVLSSATALTTISPNMADRLRSKVGSQRSVGLVPNWASIRPSSPDDIAAWRRRNGFSPEERIVLYSGNLGNKQGLEVVPPLADDLSRRALDATVVVAGAGPMLPSLQSAAMKRANLRILPLQPEESLAPMLGAAAVHLVLQKEDAADLVLPSKLTNVLAVGGAVVATCRPGTNLYDVIVANRLGVAVDPGDEGGLVDAVGRVLADEHARSEMQLSARSYAEKNLAAETLLLHLEDILYAITGRNKAHHGN